MVQVSVYQCVRYRTFRRSVGRIMRGRVPVSLGCVVIGGLFSSEQLGLREDWSFLRRSLAQATSG